MWWLYESGCEKKKEEKQAWTLPRILVLELVRNFKAAHSPTRLECAILLLAVCQYFPWLPSQNALSVGAPTSRVIEDLPTE
jgi:hypothetical protein